MGRGARESDAVVTTVDRQNEHIDTQIHGHTHTHIHMLLLFSTEISKHGYKGGKFK